MDIWNTFSVPLITLHLFSHSIIEFSPFLAHISPSESIRNSCFSFILSSAMKNLIYCPFGYCFKSNSSTDCTDNVLVSEKNIDIKIKGIRFCSVFFFFFFFETYILENYLRFFSPAFSSLNKIYSSRRSTN